MKIFWEYLGRLYLFGLPFTVLLVVVFPLGAVIYISPLILFMFGSIFYHLVLDNSNSGDL